jgi:mercuric ion transport protein
MVRAGAIGAVLAAICCAAPLLAAGLSLAGLGAWLAGAGLVVLPFTIAGLGLVAWIIHRRHARAACRDPAIHLQRTKP